MTPRGRLPAPMLGSVLLSHFKAAGIMESRPGIRVPGVFCPIKMAQQEEWEMIICPQPWRREGRRNPVGGIPGNSRVNEAEANTRRRTIVIL
jgi:hypothetical protein